MITYFGTGHIYSAGHIEGGILDLPLWSGQGVTIVEWANLILLKKFFYLGVIEILPIRDPICQWNIT